MASSDVLKRLPGKPKQRRFAILDIEARAWVHAYAVGVWCEGIYQQFNGETQQKCIREAIEFLLTPQFAGFWIYAHNGGNYDFLFLVRELLKPHFSEKYRVELTPVGSTIIRIDVLEVDTGRHLPGCEDKLCGGCAGKRQKEKLLKWSFLDSAKLMPLPLADLGEAFGITKKVKLEMSYDDLALPDNFDTMSHYLKTDCRSLAEAITAMQLRINDLGGQVGITLPATSLDLFRRKFQRRDIFTNRHWLACPEHGKEVKRNAESACVKESKEESCCLHEFVRRSYFGGPAQIFRTTFVGAASIAKDAEASQFDKEDEREARGLPQFLLTDAERASFDPAFPVAKMYDINSHYPAMMLEPMPVGEAMELNGLTEDNVYANMRSFVGIVECDVEIPRDCYLPPLPVTHQGKLMFPTGKLRGVWDAAELRLLQQVGGKIVKSYRSVWYEQEPVFVDFIREIYKFRQKHKNDCFDKTCKGCNPLWSKGMDWVAKILMNAAYGKYAMRVMRTMILMNPELHEGMTPVDFDSDIWSEDVMITPNYIVPQLAVHIVALARVKLWELNNSVISQGGRLYYNDTDSLVTAGVDLPTGPGLGALKLEATIHRAAFVLPKLYLVETEEHNKKKTAESQIRIKAKGMGPGIRLGEQGDDPLGKELSEREFRNVTIHGATLTRHRLTKLAEGLRDYAKNRTEFPRIVASPKSIQSAYDKRVIRGDFDTEPLYLEHW